MQDLAIYGAGGFGREVACLINEINKAQPSWRLVGFFDDGEVSPKSIRFAPHLGGYATLNEWRTPLAVACSIAQPKTRAFVINRIQNPLVSFPNLIAPTVHFYHRESFLIGIGNILFNGCRLSCDVKIGSHNLMNGYAAIGHDVEMGDFNVLGPSARLSGDVQLRDRNLFGVNSAVLQGLKIGSDLTLGSGSILMKSQTGPGLFHGNPARRITSGN